MLTSVMGPALMAYLMNRTVTTPQGNDDPIQVVQGCLPCRGARGWVTICIDTEGGSVMLDIPADGEPAFRITNDITILFLSC